MLSVTSEVGGNRMAGEMTVRNLIFHYQVSRERVWVDSRGCPTCWCDVYVHGSEQHRTFQKT